MFTIDRMVKLLYIVLAGMVFNHWWNVLLKLDVT